MLIFNILGLFHNFLTQTYANFRFNSCINLAEKAYKSVNARFVHII